jgi:hypothetical protein
MAKVYIDLRFKDYAEDLERGIDRALERTARSVEGRAKTIASPRGGLERRIRRTRPFKTRRGRGIAVETDEVGHLQEVGTYRKLGAKRSARGRKAAGSGPRGVKPLRFLRKGLKAHRGDLLTNLRQELPS